MNKNKTFLNSSILPLFVGFFLFFTPIYQTYAGCADLYAYMTNETGHLCQKIGSEYHGYSYDWNGGEDVPAGAVNHRYIDADTTTGAGASGDYFGGQESC